VRDRQRGRRRARWRCAHAMGAPRRGLTRFRAASFRVPPDVVCVCVWCLSLARAKVERSRSRPIGRARAMRGSVGARAVRARWTTGRRRRRRGDGRRFGFHLCGARARSEGSRRARARRWMC
jgi:hypothetical protein